MDGRNSTSAFFVTTSEAVPTGTEVDAAMCINRQNTNVLILTIIPIFSLICNAVVLVAVILHRSKLRQNNVYMYVFSVLVCNIVFSVLSVYQLLNHYFQLEGDPTIDGNSALRGWWIFRKAFMTALYLVMVGNIGSLIYAIRAGNYIVAKATSAHSLVTDSSLSSVQHQRRRAYLLITLSWIVPLFVSLLTLTGWNCAETCRCLSGCYTLQQIEIPQRDCSRVFTPLTNSYMWTVVIFWTIEMAILLVMICKTLGHSIILTATSLSKRKQVSTNDLSNLAVKGQENDAVQRTENESSRSCGKNPVKPDESTNKAKSEPTGAEDEQEPNGNGDTQESRTVEISVIAENEMPRKARLDYRRRRRYAKWLRRASKQLSYLTVVFFLSTAPGMICLLADSFQRDLIQRDVTNTMNALPILYSVICPIILAKDLAGLRAAIISLMVKFFPSSKTSKRPGTGTYTSSTLSDEKLGRR